ncbi:hypothetical protein LCGC14_0973130 [marine sediment metagenome]|uniref:Phosphatidic acid phosphatase type 2/haloperoxidase domain-containing protein n=1 Tax=marine sediment metagenome TaxID=412755 RepID=A0A0F9NFF7_9ZZZZ|nr:MAG: phosphatidylglycerophosphatase B [Candidatus Lokiarchaeum sp. GC14_75]
MFEKLNSKNLLYIILVIWAILALIFGFRDLEISIMVVDQNSPWGIFGEEFGEAPGWGLIAIGLSVLIGSYNKSIKKQKIPAYVIEFIGVVLLVLGLLFNSSYLMLIGGSMTISLGLFTLLSFKKDWAEYRKISAVITVLTIVNPLLFIQITKLLCGRIRFRDLIYFADYTPWFLPPGPTSDGSSFPSGHTSMSFMVLPLLILIRDYEWKNPKKIILTILITGWAIFVGLSRIVMGAHFASDVLFSAGMASIVTILMYRRLYLKNE